MVMQLPPFQLARVFGIPLMIDYSWLPMALLHVWLVSQFWLAREIDANWPFWAYYLIGLLVTALFFISILLHELSHALVARLEGIEIYDIQLHIFGGWARLVGEPRTALAELRIALAGPLSSLLLSLVFGLCFLLLQPFSPDPLALTDAAASAFKYLLVANLTLALFNLLPGLPLDGGRVLRALLWHWRKDVLAATKTAKQCGVAIAYLLMTYSVFLIGYSFWRGTFWQDFLAAIWLLVVGFFLMNSAEKDYRFRVAQHSEETAARQLVQRWKIAGTVGAVMRTPAVSVQPELRVSEFIDRVLAAHRQTSFPVARDGRLYGVLLLERLRALPQAQWEKVVVSEVMEPVDDSHFITARASLEYAARRLKASHLSQLAVLDSEGVLVGSLSQTEITAADS